MLQSFLFVPFFIRKAKRVKACQTRKCGKNIFRRRQALITKQQCKSESCPLFSPPFIRFPFAFVRDFFGQTKGGEPDKKKHHREESKGNAGKRGKTAKIIKKS